MKNKKIYFLFLLLLQILIIENMYAINSIRLFKDGKFVSDYDQIIEKIIANDHGYTELEFSKKSFPLKGLVGFGGTTVIVDIGEDRVLRIPKTSELSLYIDDEYFKVDRERLDDYLSTSQALKNEFHLPVPHVFLEESLESENSYDELEYIIVEKLTIEFNLKEFLQSAKKVKKTWKDYFFRNKNTDSLKLEKKEIVDKFISLLELIVQAKNLVQIRDLHAENIVWVKNRGWVLLDFSEELKYYSREMPMNKHFLSHLKFPKKWDQIFSEEMIQARFDSFQGL